MGSVLISDGGAGKYLVMQKCGEPVVPLMKDIFDLSELIHHFFPDTQGISLAQSVPE